MIKKEKREKTFEALLDDLTSLLVDQTPEITNAYLSKLEKVCARVRDLYVKPQIEGVDKLVKMNFDRNPVQEKDDGDYTLGFYNSKKDLLVINIGCLRNIELPSVPVVLAEDNVPVNFENAYEKGYEKELKRFIDERNKRVISLIIAVIHEYRHSFQDKFNENFKEATAIRWKLQEKVDKIYKSLTASGRCETKEEKIIQKRAFKTADFQLYGDDLDVSDEDIEASLTKEEKKEEEYNKLLGGKGEEIQKEKEEFFLRKEQKAVDAFIKFLSTIDPENFGPLEANRKRLSKYFYIKALHETDARTAEMVGIRKFHKDLNEYITNNLAEENDVSGAKRIKIEVWNKLVDSVHCECESRGKVLRLMRGLRENMKLMQPGHLVEYAMILGSEPNGEKQFQDTLAHFKHLEEMKHLFTKEMQEELRRLLRENGIGFELQKKNSWEERFLLN